MSALVHCVKSCQDVTRRHLKYHGLERIFFIHSTKPTICRRAVFSEATTVYQNFVDSRIFSLISHIISFFLNFRLQLFLLKSRQCAVYNVPARVASPWQPGELMTSSPGPWPSDLVTQLLTAGDDDDTGAEWLDVCLCCRAAAAASSKDNDLDLDGAPVAVQQHTPYIHFCVVVVVVVVVVINQPRTGLSVDSSQLTFLPTSKSRDTKTRTNIKNPARTNLDIVP